MTDETTLIKQLERALGRDRILVDDTAAPYGMRGLAPLAVALPEDRDQAADVIRLVSEAPVRVVFSGGGTTARRPRPDASPAVVLSTERLRRIVHHEPRDLTITVESGVVLAELNAMLAEHNQRLTVDVPRADRATVGGVCATNDSGPLRLAHGTPRDQVLAMQVVGHGGTPARSGAPVVKSVAGYDMHRLHVGACGSLGLISEITFRLVPLPDCFGIAIARCADGEQAENAMRQILAARLRPSMMTLVTPFGHTDMVDGEAANHIAPDDWSLIVGFEDCDEAVAWQCRRIGEILPFRVDVLDPSTSRTVYQAVREWPGNGVAAGFKATMKSSEVVAFHAWAGERGFRLVSHAGSGIVHGQSDDPASIDAADDLVAAAASGGGHLTWTALPDDNDVPIYQPPRPDIAIMKRIKQAFDPNDSFAPGPWTEARP